MKENHVEWLKTSLHEKYFRYSCTHILTGENIETTEKSDFFVVADFVFIKKLFMF